MATITNSIGTGGGRDYSSVNAWAAALPANLVTAGNSYIGEVYNDGLLTSASNPANSISGHTADATHTIILRAAVGQGFKDSANAQTNALAFNQANGAAIQCTNNYGSALVIGDDYVTVDGLQFQSTGGPATCVALSNTSRPNTFIKNCIVESIALGINAQRSNVQNCAVILKGAGGNGINFANSSTSGICEGNTVVRTSDNAAAATGINYLYGAGASCRNNAVFGFTTVGTNWPSGAVTNATDQASLPAGTGLTSQTYANQFVVTAATGRDFRLKGGVNCTLLNAGTTGGGPSTDIVGTSRPQGGGVDIGCWEYVAAGGGTAYALSAAQGAFSETGKPAVPIYGRKVIGAQASFSENGQAAALKCGRRLVGARASFAETGSAATLGLLKLFGAARGSVALAGKTAVFQSAGRIPVAPAAVAWTGYAAKFSGAGQIWTRVTPAAAEWVPVAPDGEVWASRIHGSTTWTLR